MKLPQRPTRLAGLLAAGVALSIVGGAQFARAEVAPLDLVAPVTDYKIYVSAATKKLVADTKAFTDAVKAGDLKKAQALFGPTRMHYEQIEPIAELFDDLDKAIDSRADDHDKKEDDDGFTGFHRLEYGLFEKKSTDGLSPTADKLQTDVEELAKRIKDLTFPPEKVVGGAAALMEEVAKTKISGEEDRYSHTDLYDFQANFDGSKKIFDLFKPLIEKNDKTFVKKVDGNFTTVAKTLGKYKTANGYESYEKLTDADRKVLAASVNTLAEDLSTLRGKLGLN
ncbi:iron uptake system protein EfeO [Methylocella silvestris]|uniref:EfeM/EfeO family lipoprotein n=1 Tax=Methylocella silvestris TaxID=199596 RepID=A0A2J7TIT1_METSI|nr:iron uptake system protein EfeO [Methylocella silvestris]PNG26656.1 EfeM/EfeO family lipoprotein [Methylocella silvestris]